MIWRVFGMPDCAGTASERSDAVWPSAGSSGRLKVLLPANAQQSQGGVKSALTHSPTFQRLSHNIGQAVRQQREKLTKTEKVRLR